MEATGVYWKPVWHILDDGEFALVLANAAHVKNVPGRKTDVNDAMWLAELLAHGLIRASFVPDTQTQEMRSLLRTRKQLVREQSSHVLRVQKTLEDANIKLDSVLTDLMGKSGRAMLEALIAGETNPVKLAGLADRRVKASPEELREALRGRVTKHHRFLLRLHLNQIDALDAAMATLDAQVEANLGPFRTAVELVTSVPGVKNLGAHVIVKVQHALAVVIREVFDRRFHGCYSIFDSSFAVGLVELIGFGILLRSGIAAHRGVPLCQTRHLWRHARPHRRDGARGSERHP